LNQCDHKECGKEDLVWFPSTDIKYSEIEKHPWCKTCGVVKNISDDRPKKIGYWMNKLSFISDKLSLKQCQRRLIAKEIESFECFHDMFGTYGSDQEKMFIEIISKSTKIRSIDIRSVFS
jgi:hypothetical protein